MGTVRPRLVQRTIFGAGDFPTAVSSDCLREGLDTWDQWSGNRGSSARADLEGRRYSEVPGAA